MTKGLLTPTMFWPEIALIYIKCFLSKFLKLFVHGYQTARNVPQFTHNEIQDNALPLLMKKVDINCMSEIDTMKICYISFN